MREIKVAVVPKMRHAPACALVPCFSNKLGDESGAEAPRRRDVLGTGDRGQEEVDAMRMRALVMLAGLASCGTPAPVSNAPTPVSNTVPISDCNNPQSVMQGSFLVTVTAQNRNDDVSPLRLAVRIANSTNRPISWSNIFPPPVYLPSYALRDSAGREFAPSDQGGLDYGSAQRNINPGRELGGVIAFDVPRGDYSFIVTHIMGQGGLVQRDTVVMRCFLGGPI
jgi:hypothetical protein